MTTRAVWISTASLLGGSLILAALWGGRPAEGTGTAAGADPVQLEGDPVLVGTLRGRGFAVHLYTGNLYSVEDDRGEIVGALLTESQFAESFPDLHEQTRDMFASPIADNLTFGEPAVLERPGRIP